MAKRKQIWVDIGFANYIDVKYPDISNPERTRKVLDDITINNKLNKLLRRWEKNL